MCVRWCELWCVVLWGAVPVPVVSGFSVCPSMRHPTHTLQDGTDGTHLVGEWYAYMYRYFVYVACLDVLVCVCNISSYVCYVLL
jgi:hypothetical protein